MPLDNQNFKQTGYHTRDVTKFIRLKNILYAAVLFQGVVGQTVFILFLALRHIACVLSEHANVALVAF